MNDFVIGMRDSDRGVPGLPADLRNTGYVPPVKVRKINKDGSISKSYKIIPAPDLKVLKVYPDDKTTRGQVEGHKTQAKGRRVFNNYASEYYKGGGFDTGR